MTPASSPLERYTIVGLAECITRSPGFRWRQSQGNPDGSMPPSMSPGMIPLEQGVAGVAIGGDVGQEVEDLLAGQLVEQALGHLRDRRLLAAGDLGLLEDLRLGAGQRVLDDLHEVGRLPDDQAGDDLA